MTIYLLSERAKRWTWKKWKRRGGCGLSDGTTSAIGRVLGRKWVDSTTLGELQDACVVAGREMSRFGKDHLKLRDFAVVEYDL